MFVVAATSVTELALSLSVWYQYSTGEPRPVQHNRQVQRSERIGLGLVSVRMDSVPSCENIYASGACRTPPLFDSDDEIVPRRV